MCADARAGRGSFQPGAAATADYFAREMKKLGIEVVRQSLRSNTAQNVIGIYRGTDKASRKAVIVSSHYDHLGSVDGVIYPGADDNASGAAVLLAIARDAVRRKYAHTILFIAFGAEEAGLVGSAYYVSHPVWPLNETLALINFDMVGRNFFEAGSNKPATVGVVGLDVDKRARAAADAAAKRAKLELVSAPAGLVRLVGFSFRTDDWWFRGRIPLAVHFSTGLHEDYHKPTDTADKLVPAQMSRIARTAAGLLAHLARSR